ncbi:MAG: hypothetical protein ACJ73D_00450 [Pyrinomonadaceae bacterium]
MIRRKAAEGQRTTSHLGNRLVLAISVVSGVIYYFSNPKPQSYYDYTFRVAANMLHGRIAFNLAQPGYLNEFVPFEGYYYSVFPLGAVLSMTPFALLRVLGVITEMPGAFIAALLAGASCWFCLRIAERYEIDNTKRVLYSVAILFGTFTWTNLTFDGAWQLALGFAMLGELGAIYFTVFDRRPLLAGIFFAMAFGNRTECLLTAPVLLYLLNRDEREVNRRDAERPRKDTKKHKRAEMEEKTIDDVPSRRLRVVSGTTALFCAVPFVLGVATLIYNYVRFHSFTDFGYARIPGVLQEPWYKDGIFSVNYIPRQAYEMLLKPWNWKSSFPYLIPDGFSDSILLSSPFLLLILRVGAKDGALKLASWISVALLTLTLWMHGNSGGWQFAYRYAMVLLPWMFLLLLESAKKTVTKVEWALIGFSILANAYATILFNWTEYVKP